MIDREKIEQTIHQIIEFNLASPKDHSNFDIGRMIRHLIVNFPDVFQLQLLALTIHLDTKDPEQIRLLSELIYQQLPHNPPLN